MLVNHTTPSLRVKLLPGVLIRVDRRARLTPGSAIGIIGVLIRRVACNVGQRADAVLSVVQVVIGGLRSSRLLDAVTAIVVLELHALRADGGSRHAVTRIPGVGYIVQRVAEVIHSDQIAARVVIVGRLAGETSDEDSRTVTGADHLVESVVYIVGNLPIFCLLCAVPHVIILIGSPSTRGSCSYFRLRWASRSESKSCSDLRPAYSWPERTSDRSWLPVWGSWSRWCRCLQSAFRRSNGTDRRKSNLGTSHGNCG